MRSELRPDEISSYRANGFVVLEGFLDDSELAEWRSAVDTALADRATSFLPKDNDAPINKLFAAPATSLSEEELRDRDYYTKVFTQRVNLWQTSPDIAALVVNEDVGRLAADLAGVDGIRLWSDQALVKEPYANPTAFHLDGPLWSFYSPDAMTIWVALDDATVENGCMCYIPGSHKVCTFESYSIGSDLGAMFVAYPELAEIGPVHCPVPAGAAVVHNGLTAHGAGANMTAGRRRAMTMQFMPDGATFNGIQNVLPSGYFDSLRVGDCLDDHRFNPLLFSRQVHSTAG